MTFAVSAVVVGVAGIGMSVAGGMQQASAQEKAAKYQNEAGGRQQAQSEWEGKQIWHSAEQESKTIRAKAIQMRGSQIAQQASSGVLIGDGSAQALLDETTKLADQDVMATLYNGARGVLAKEEAGRLAAADAQFQSNQLYASASATRTGTIASGLSSLSSLGMAASSKFGSKK